MAPLQRRFEGGLRQTLSVLLGSAVSELAWCGRSSPRALEVKASGLLRLGNVLVGCRPAQLVPLAVMAPLQTTLGRCGLRQTLSVLLGSAVSELSAGSERNSPNVLCRVFIKMCLRSARPRQLREGVDAHGQGQRARLGPRLQAGAVMAPPQRQLEGGLRRTLTEILGSEVSDRARDRAKLPTCFGGLVFRVAQMGFAAQATWWSAVDLHKAAMTTICEALGRPLQGAHPEEMTALAAKADLLMARVAVGDHAKVRGKSVGSGQTSPGSRRRVWLGTWWSWLIQWMI